MPPVPETDSPTPHPSSEETTQKYKDILKSNGVYDEVAEVTIKDAGLKGEGFMSVANLVTVTFSNPAKKPLNLFVKSVTTNPSHVKFLEDTKLFEKESTFFTGYVKAVTQFCREKGHEDLLDIYPKCYHGDTELIVLENLVLDKGYELLDKTQQQDLKAAKLALTTLAKHHAISYAYIKEIGGVSIFMKKFPAVEYEPFQSDSVRGMMGPGIENGIKSNLEILRKSSVAGKEEAAQLLVEQQGKAWDTIMNAIKFNEDDPIHVLNHGDFWNNNMMFHRNKSTNELDGHKAIDLQAVRYDSPGADLGYFIFSSVKGEVRRNHLKTLLTHYLDVFNDTTEKLDHPANLSYEALNQSWLRKFQFGFWFCASIMASKGSFIVMKQIDITKVEMSQFGIIINELLQKWMEENPDALEEDAKSIVNLMGEYKKLIGEAAN